MKGVLTEMYWGAFSGQNSVGMCNRYNTFNMAIQLINRKPEKKFLKAGSNYIFSYYSDLERIE